MRKRTILIDGDFLMFFCGYNKVGSTFVKTLEQSKLEVDSFISSILLDLGVIEASNTNNESWEYLIFLTSSYNFRYLYNPEYKQNRKDKTKPLYFQELRAYLKEKYPVVSHNGYEADDCVRFYKEHLAQNECVFISNDKDILKLPGLHYNPVKKTWISTTPSEADLYFWSSMLIGDRGDNIKGIEGMGPKGAAIILKGCNTPQQMRSCVLEAYIKHYNEEYVGICEFYKNYRSLYIVKTPFEADFEYVQPEPINFSNFADTRIFKEDPADNAGPGF